MDGLSRNTSFKKMGFSNSKIAKQLKISRNRVIEYLRMTPDEFAGFIAALQTRARKLDPYENDILTWLAKIQYETM